LTFAFGVDGVGLELDRITGTFVLLLLMRVFVTAEEGDCVCVCGCVVKGADRGTMLPTVVPPLLLL
jgi:hypothetical protein